MAAERLLQAGFAFSPDYFYDDSDDDEQDERQRDPFPEEQAWHKQVDNTNVWNFRPVVVTIYSGAIGKRFHVDTCDIEHKPIAMYRSGLSFVDAVDAAIDLVVKLERNELEIVGRRFVPTQESMNLNEKRHDPSCNCGFCQNMRKLTKKGDKPEGKEKTEEAQVQQKPWVDAKTGKQRTVPFVSRTPLTQRPKPPTSGIGNDRRPVEKRPTAESIVSTLLDEGDPAATERLRQKYADKADPRMQSAPAAYFGGPQHHRVMRKFRGVHPSGRVNPLTRKDDAIWQHAEQQGAREQGIKGVDLGVDPALQKARAKQFWAAESRVKKLLDQ